MKKLPHNKKFLSTQHQLGVVLEDINSKFDQVLDGHAALDKKISGFYKEFVDFRNEANWKFEQILEELREIKVGRIVSLEERMKRIEQWISSRNS